jgi:hypothetical protein
MRPILVERNLPRDGNSPAARRTRSVTVNLAESPLGWLYARGLLSNAQFDAGELLRRDFEHAGLGANVTMNWNVSPPDKNRRGAPNAGDATHRQLCAKERFDGAIAVAGVGLADILWRVVCSGETVPDAEKGLGWPSRAGRLVLTLALDRVAGYYQIK